jgi:hypothetical protein
MARTFPKLIQLASVAVLAVCVGGSKPAGSRKTALDTEQSITATILHLEDALDQAETHHDVATAGKLIASDYRGITIGGRIIQKNDVLAAVNGDQETASQSTERDVRVLENAAIYTALVVDRGIDDRTREPYTLTTRVTDIWQKQGKEWKLVHDHASAMKPAQDVK